MNRRQIAALIGVLVVAAAVHLFVFIAQPNKTTPDSAEYLSAAASLRAGKGFLDPHGVPDTLRTPGYPLFLAAFTGHARVSLVPLLQHAAGVALVAFVFFLTLKIAGDGAALAAAALLALDAGFAQASDLVMTEALFTFVLVGLVYALLERRFVLAAIACTLLIALRPIAIFLPIIAMFFVSAKKTKRVVAAVVFLVVAYSFPLAWTMRNDAVSGVATYSTIGGKNMLYWRAAGTRAMRAVGPFVSLPFVERERDEKFLRAVFALQAQLTRDVDRVVPIEHSAPALARRASYERKLGATIVRSDPVATTLSAWTGALHMLLDGPVDVVGFLGGAPQSLAAVLTSLHTWIELAGLLAAIVVALRTRNRALVLVVVIVAYFVILSAGPEAYAYAYRFRAPIAPLLAIATAIAFTRNRGAQAA